MERSIEKIPTYALDYLVNGCADCLTDEEQNEIDATIKRMNIVDVIPFAEGDEISNEPYFSSYPLWGKPGEVEDCLVIFKSDQ